MSSLEEEAKEGGSAMPGVAGSAAASTSDASLSIGLGSIGDAPTTDDEIGFKPYVAAIATFLLSDQTVGPLTLSIAR